LPKKISSPTKKVGEPKVPRATDCSVLRDRRSLTVGSCIRSRARAPSNPEVVQRPAHHVGIVHLFGFLPHVVEYDLDILGKAPIDFGSHGAAHDL
jgi:hypothetical protein